MVQVTTPTAPVADSFFIVKACSKKISSKGDAYLDLVFADARGEIPAKLWDYKETVHDWIAAGMIVKVRGNEERWNDKKQYRIQRIRRVGPEDRVDLHQLVPCAPYEGADMFSRLLDIIDAFTDPDLKALTARMVADRRERILTCPAAVRLHHAVCGGLLYHTLSILHLAEGVCRVYPFVRRDLLYSGAILHDLAKIDELVVDKTGIASGYSARGELLGHLVMGAIALDHAADELGTPEETRTLLQHMLISHHGTPEFGAAVRPMVLEAELLSMLDNMDATVNQITNAIQTVEPGGFSAKLWSLDQRKFYRPIAGDDPAEKFHAELPERESDS